MESDAWQWQVGRVTYVFAQMWENGAPNAPETFVWPAEGGNFFTPCIYTQNAQIFVEVSNVGEKHEKKFNPLIRPPSQPLTAGPFICHLSLEGGGGGAREGTSDKAGVGRTKDDGAVNQDGAHGTMKRTLPATNKEHTLNTRDPRSGGAYVVDGRDNAWRSRAPGPHAHGITARQVVDGLRTEVCGQRKQPNDPHNNQHNPNTPTTGCRKRHIPPHPAQPQHTNHWAPRTRKRHQQEHGCSGRQKAAT